MQEICQSGSEGGAKRSFVPTPIGEKWTRPEGRLSCSLVPEIFFVGLYVVRF